MAKPLERIFILIGLNFTVLAGLAHNKFVKEYFLVTVAATLTTTPVLAYHFFYLLPYNLPANFVILPSSSLMICSSAIIGVVGLLSLPMAEFLSGTLYYLLKFYEAVCEFFVGLPGAIIVIGQPPAIVIVMWFWCCALLTVILSGKLNKIVSRLKILIMCVALMIICQVSWRYFFSTKTEIALLDVSGGNCAIVHKDSKTYMIDCGGFFNADVKNNSGLKTIAPFLNYKGIEKLNGFFSTYSDIDYLFNFDGLKSQKEIEAVFISASIGSVIGFDTGNLPVYEIYPGDTVRDGELSFTCLTPGFTFLASCNGVNILIMGEKDHNAEQEILDALGERIRDIDIVKLPANSAANSELLRAASPRVLVACNGRYGFKWISSENESLAAEMDIPLFDTAKNGAIIFEIARQRDGIAAFNVYTMK